MAGAMLRAAGLRRRGLRQHRRCRSPTRSTGRPGRVFVVELSSFQIEGIVTFKPRAAALLNLSRGPPRPLRQHGGLRRRQARASSAIRTPRAIAVLNADDPGTLRLETPARRRLFSRLAPVRRRLLRDGGRPGDRGLAGEPDAELFHASDVPLAGVQNLENAMAAALLARAVGVEPAAIRAGLRGFTGLPHRLEKVGEQDGVTFYDDSKGTNPGATMKAIEGFADGTVHLILGGRNKDADLATLTPMVAPQGPPRLPDRRGGGGIRGARSDGAVPFERSETLDRAGALGGGAGAAGRRGRPLAGLRQLRPVPELQPPRRRLPGAGARRPDAVREASAAWRRSSPLTRCSSPPSCC